MAYRIKGALTLKQRRDLAAFCWAYYYLLGDVTVGAGAKALVEATLLPMVRLSQLALVSDDYLILKRSVDGSV